MWMAFRCQQGNRTFALYDEPSKNSSSRVAAGLYNPVLSKRQKLSFNASAIYPPLGRRYQVLEQHLGEKVCHHLHTAYILESLRELNDWAALSESKWFSDFVQLKNERISDHILSDFGYLDIQDSGWVDIPKMLNAFVARIQAPSLYVQEHFDADALISRDGGFEYKGIEAEHIVFCQGTGISTNPITAGIRLKPAKGEILNIEADDRVEGLVPQNGVFMLPLGHDTFRVGSNFTWEDLSTESTEAARNEIVQKFTRWYKGPFHIASQVAGVRPSSLDRRPLLGRLDFHPNAFLLNGFGSKGVSHAPHYSEMLYRLIYEDKLVDRDIDVKRFI